nr:hypothetical protein [Tanacetum cinerariifolium]
AFRNKQYKPKDMQELIRKLFNDVQNIHDELAEYINTRSWNRHAFHNYDDDDDDEDYTIVITPEEPDNSLSMGDEHLDTISATESNEVIKSSVEDLVPIPISYPIEDSDSFFEKSDTSLSYSDNSLPKFKTFSDHTEETLLLMLITLFPKKNSGSTTIHADISLPDLKCFNFKSEPNPGELTSIVDFGIRENVLSATNVNLSPEEDHSPLFAYVVWIFFSFLTYPVAPPYLLFFGNEDTIFDPGISNYHFLSLLSGVSHQSGTFMKLNVYPNHLNESPMEILSSTCFPMDQ